MAKESTKTPYSKQKQGMTLHKFVASGGKPKDYKASINKK